MHNSSLEKRIYPAEVGQIPYGKVTNMKKNEDESFYIIYKVIKWNRQGKLLSYNVPFKKLRLYYYSSKSQIHESG